MNLKKLDEKDIVFIDQPFTDEEQKQFSEFLRNRKLKKEKKQVIPVHRLNTHAVMKVT